VCPGTKLAVESGDAGARDKLLLLISRNRAWRFALASLEAVLEQPVGAK
jgi:hypothetical protein